MIKTVQYNDFTQLSYDVKRDFELLKEEIQEFINNGGNILLPVLDRETSSFFEWFHTIFQDKSEAYLINLIENKIIDNPFDFIVNQETKTIHFSDKVPFYWLRNNIGYFPNLMTQSLRKLVTQIDGWELGLDYYLFSDDNIERRKYLFNEDLDKDSDKYPKLSYKEDNDKNRIEQTYHPLITIMRHFHSTSFNNLDIFYNAIFSTQTQTDFRKLWQHNPDFLKDIFNKTKKGEDRLPRIFYKYNICRDFIDTNENSILLNMVKNALYENDVDFIKEHISKWDLKLLEKDLGDYEFLLHYTNNSEVINILLKNGANYNKNPENIVPSLFHYTSSSVLIDEILSYDKNVKENLEKYPDEFYKTLFLPDNKSRSFQQNTLRLLVEKYNYFLETEEYLPIFLDFNKTENLKWLINNGVDVRKCSSFMEKVLMHKKDGLKYLKQLQKENLFNSFYPDPLFHILSKYKNKDFSTWLDKCPTENYTRYTINGYPVWWGFNSTNMWDIVKTKVTDYSQLSKNGLSWFYHVAKRNARTDYKEVSELNAFKFMIKNQPNLILNLDGIDNEGKNVFHYLFKEKYSYNTSSDLLLSVLEHSNNDIIPLLLQEDKNGITPLGELYASVGKKDSYAVEQYLRIIINYCCKEPINNNIIGSLEKNNLFSLNQIIKVSHGIESTTNPKEIKNVTIADLFLKVIHDEKAKSTINYLKLQQSIEQSEKRNNRIKI